LVSEIERLLTIISEERQKLECVLSSVSDGVCVVDRDFNILTLNPAAEQMTGWPEAEVIGRHYAEVFKLSDDNGRDLGQANCVLCQAMEEGKPVYPLIEERTTIGRNGQHIFIAAGAAPLLDDNGDVVGGLATFRDISSEKEAERAKLDFLAIVSHHLRSPIAKLNTSLELILNSRLDELSQQKALESAFSQSTSLAEFVEVLLGAAQLGLRKISPKQQPVTIVPLIKRQIEAFKTSFNGHRFDVIAPPQAVIVWGDESKIEVVLNNLLESVTNLSSPEERVIIEIQEKASDVVVSIGNERVYIPPHDLNKMFELFPCLNSREAQIGSGQSLGLYIAKKLMDSQRAAIWAESQMGRGLRFSFSLPRLEVKDERENPGHRRQSSINQDAAAVSGEGRL
jgi:PAS domain S-box-containing protein